MAPRLPLNPIRRLLYTNEQFRVIFTACSFIAVLPLTMTAACLGKMNIMARPAITPRDPAAHALQELHSLRCWGA